MEITDYKQRVLFVCSVLGARSQVARHFLKQCYGSSAIIESASFESGEIAKKMLDFLAAQDIIIPEQSPDTVFKRFRNREEYDVIVLMCNDAAREQCPIFTRSVNSLYPEPSRQLLWQIPDFKSIEGTDAFVREQWQHIVDEIKQNVTEFALNELCTQSVDQKNA